MLYGVSGIKVSIFSFCLCETFLPVSLIFKTDLRFVIQFHFECQHQFQALIHL